MTKSKILSSALVMGMVSFGAYAADELITGGANTCTADVLGVSADGATANTIAVWSINEYTLNPGEYLNVTETSVDKTTCPPGSYCVGGVGFTVENAATSIAQCPTEYPKSRAGAGAQNQCYTACTVATANIAHAMAVGGNDYFGDGMDACYATACATGYHIDGDIEIIEKTPLIPVDYTQGGIGYESIDASGNIERSSDTSVIPENSLSAPNTWATAFNDGVVYGQASCQPKMSPVVEYLMNNQVPLLQGAITIDEFKQELEVIAGPIKAEYAAQAFTRFSNGDISEKELYKLVWIVFFSEHDANYSTSSTGQYCYCRPTEFFSSADNSTTSVSAPWVVLNYNFQKNSAEYCAEVCAYDCAEELFQADDDFGLTFAFRAAIFGSFSVTETATCAANTINIDWNPDNGGEHTKNMCTYDGEVTLPTPDPVKPGYTFTGWKLVDGTTTE